MCTGMEPAALASLYASVIGTGLAVKGTVDANKAKPPQLPKPPAPPQTPKAPDQTAARQGNKDAAIRAGIASTYKSPLGGVPVGSLNLGSSQLLGG